MRGMKGDLLGFTFNNIHSSALGLTRTLNGLYEKKTSSGFRDIVLQMPKSNLTHYFGTTLDERTIQIDFAFEGLSDVQLSAIKKSWNDKDLHDLILDEEPYKVYSAKVSDISTIKHVCFENNNVRYYNGSGSVNFICPFPYAKSRFAYIEDYTINNIPEWCPDSEDATRLLLTGSVVINDATTSSSTD